MSKESDRLFYQSIGNSIQANKDKIEKLEKQVDRLKKKNKELTKYKERNEKVNELKKVLNNEILDMLPFDISEQVQDLFDEILEDKEDKDEFRK